jgi:hypothetical protein
MAHRDFRKPLELWFAELLKLALQNAPCGRPTQALMGLVYLGQQGYIFRGVFARKAPADHRPAHNLPAL